MPVSLPKNSKLLGTVLGALLLLGGIALVVQTEQALRVHLVAAVRHGGDALDLGETAQSAPGMHGQMVRLVGVPHVVDAPRDPDFGVQATVPTLIRHVEMFQWREVDISGQRHYEQDWVDHPLDAGSFAVPAGHANPGAFPLQGARFDADSVRLGDFRLSPTLLHALPGSEPVPPDTQHLPSNLAASFSLYRDALVTSGKPEHPQLGDLRVSWEAVPAQQVTVYAKLDGDLLVPAPDVAGGTGYEIQTGNRALTDVLPDEPAPPAWLFVRRLLALLLGIAGAFLLCRLLPRIAGDWPWAVALGALPVALAASVTAWGGTAGGAWLGVALLAVAGAVWRWRRSGVQSTRGE